MNTDGYFDACKNSFPSLSFNYTRDAVPIDREADGSIQSPLVKRFQIWPRSTLIGFYDEREFALYVLSISNELKVPVRYLKGDKPHGSAGGLYNFIDMITEDDPSHNLPAEL